MLRLANQVIDVYDDVMKEGIKKLAAAAPNVDVMSPDERARLCDTDFALSVITKSAAKLNKYPINNEDSAWLSNEYFDMTHHRLPKEAAAIAAFHIKKACDRFGIAPKPAVEGLAKEASSNVYYEGEEQLHRRSPITRASFDKFAEVDKICESYTMAQYAFSTPTHVKLAAKYFEEHGDKIPLAKRHKYAAAIQRRAHELGLPTFTGAVGKYASDHYSPMVDAHLLARRDLVEVTNPDLLPGLNKLAGMKKDLTPSEFAQVLHGFDKKAKLDRYYGSHLQDPYQATFASQPDPYAAYRTKVANRALTGEEVRKLVHAKEDKIIEYFGKSMADELKKDPVAIFDSLPMDAKEIIVSFADGTL